MKNDNQRFQRKSLVALLLCSALAVACAKTADVPKAVARVVDLGHAIAATDPSWDGPAGFERHVLATFEKEGYTAGRITVEEHFGTHFDAPAHFAKDGWTVDAIPVERLERAAVVIDVSDKAKDNADYRLSAADVQAWEAAHGAVPQGSLVFVATGWDQFWPDRSRYMREADGVKHFPGLSVEAASYLARDRGVAAIGIDTPSIDYGPSTNFEAHRVTMAANLYHIENAAGLTKLPATGFRVVVAPIKIAGGSGGPVRVFALIP